MVPFNCKAVTVCGKTSGKRRNHTIDRNREQMTIPKVKKAIIECLQANLVRRSYHGCKLCHTKPKDPILNH